MDRKPILAAALFVLVALSAGVAKEPAAPTKPAAKPPARDTVLATVGNAKITRNQIDGLLQSAAPDVPPERRGALRERILADQIVSELMHAYVVAQKVPCDANDLAELKARIAAAATKGNVTPAELMKKAGLTEERLKDRVRLRKLVKDTTGKKKLDAFIQAHPSCFNGTKVQASHILIACKPAAATAEQKAAVNKLKKVADDVQGGKLTFADAAKQHSSCPSGKAKGGDLGEFDFTSMVPPFAMKAFSMKVGQTSGVVRTQFGFHLIRVTKRTAGKAKPRAGATRVAERALIAVLQNKVFDQGLAACPIVIRK
ncbi:MAG TPA: peptidylprolyl isomerase [Phycisphaerae bacterium]|nr:peptidylprolyl isomerase [Phycisphaerae bacterium]